MLWYSLPLKKLFMFTCRVISNHRVKDRKVMFGDQGIFVDRDLFFEAGMFPEIPIMEDYQFSLTLKEMGIKLGMADRRIYTSDRRFPKGTIPKLKLMWKMNRPEKTVPGRDGHRGPCPDVPGCEVGVWSPPKGSKDKGGEGMRADRQKNMPGTVDLDRTKGLQAYVESEDYRRALGLPAAREEEYRLLAQGEYNRNYLFTHPVTGKRLVLRLNFGSQMHLEHQIEYEYEALRLLEGSGRTPRPLYVDGSRDVLPYGVMVMEYLPGHALDYEAELFRAADCLADIHSVPVPSGHHLIRPENPVRAILR